MSEGNFILPNLRMVILSTFFNWETEARRGQVICPRLHNQEKAKPELEASSLTLKAVLFKIVPRSLCVKYTVLGHDNQSYQQSSSQPSSSSTHLSAKSSALRVVVS